MANKKTVKKKAPAQPIVERRGRIHIDVEFLSDGRLRISRMDVGLRCIEVLGVLEHQKACVFGEMENRVV